VSIKAGVQMKFDTRRNAVGVILLSKKIRLQQIFETAGSKKSNKLKQSI
jgi:hypothetical protein